jgi:hypothetical protein
MKFLKGSSLNKFKPNSQQLFTNAFGRTVMDGTGALMLPKGTTAQRPKVSGVRAPAGANGYMRYNSQTNVIEGYINGVWEVVKAPSTSSISKQTLGPGDATTTIFGPLSFTPANDDNIIVLVGNVWQISVSNYSILYNYLGGNNAFIQFTSPVPIGTYITIYYGFV